MVAAKQLREEVEENTPWRLPKQSYLVHAAITELLSEHEVLYAPHPLVDFYPHVLYIL